MKICLGSDESGFELKEIIKAYLMEQELVPIEQLEDMGVQDLTPVDYPDIALKVAEAIANESFDRGILVCGTGIGMAIAANKVPGVRAAQVYDPYSAERARKSNNAQVITFGALTTGKSVAISLLRIWLESEFQEGRSTRKVEKINAIDKKYRKNPFEGPNLN